MKSTNDHNFHQSHEHDHEHSEIHHDHEHADTSVKKLLTASKKSPLNQLSADLESESKKEDDENGEASNSGEDSD